MQYSSRENEVHSITAIDISDSSFSASVWLLRLRQVQFVYISPNSWDGIINRTLE